MNIRIYDHSYHDVISGGDVIVAEFAKHWEIQGHGVCIYTHPDAAAFFRSRGIPEKNVSVVRRIRTAYTNVLIGSIAHLFNGVLDAVMMKNPTTDVIFSGSWSLQDIVPALIDSWKTPEAKLVVGCYIFLESPLHKTYGSTWINRFAFWLEYLVGITLTRVNADHVWTASPIDADHIRSRWHIPAYAIRGGADIHAAKESMLHTRNKRYDAVYIGRFHPQKNIIELIRIWQRVTMKKSGLHLVIAGAGFLKDAICREIQLLGLASTVTVLPMIDGKKKFTLLSESRLFISASHHDTGNLALDEALACGVPGVVYRIPKLVYPQGVVFVPPFDTERFADVILALLTDEPLRNELSMDAILFAETINWVFQSQSALRSLYNHTA